MRKRWIALLGIAVVLTVGTAYLLAKPSSGEHLQLLTKADATWPQNRAWSWSFPVPADFGAGKMLGLEIREKTTATGKQPPTISSPGTPIARDKADSTVETSWIGGGSDNPQTGRVAVTLLDLNEIGAMSAKPGSTLRILANLSVGGTGTSLSSDSIYLDGTSIAGWSLEESHWDGGELLVLHFATESEGQQHDYDLVLVEKKQL